MRGDREPHRTHQMRRDPQPDITFGQRGANTPQRALFEERQVAMDQAWRGRRSGRTQIALLQQDHPQPATGGVARNANAVQASANNREIVVRHALPSSGLIPNIRIPFQRASLRMLESRTTSKCRSLVEFWI